jgi:ubiquinone/menaquinone biosynthesis C-methylase UbiE
MTTTAQASGYYKVSNPLFVRIYERVMPQGLAQGQGGHLEELLAGLTGRVVEIGVGGGPTFSRYPDGVSELVGVEPEPRMRALAEREAATAAMPVQIVDAVADHLPFEDGSFDAAVLAGVLCTLPDPERALAEAHRVIRPDGELRYYEHVKARCTPMRQSQWALDHTFWPLINGGCHTNRDSEASIRAAGFEIETSRRFPFRPCALAWPVTPHVIGVARRSE